MTTCMWRPKVFLAGLFIAASASSGAALAQGLQKDVDKCIVVFVNNLAAERRIASAKNIRATCTCYANKKAQRLSNSDCPRLGTVTAREMGEMFQGDW